MGESWRVADEEIKKVKVLVNGKNELVTVLNQSSKLTCVGTGTDAAVFQYSDQPSYAYKVYSDDRINKLNLEKEVYGKLGTSNYFPTYFGDGANYIVLSYEQGNTLYDCLLKGIHIPKKVIEDVDNARKYVREQGMNPRDIHLKNIIMHENKSKIIDVSEYQQPGNDYRWEHLKRGYEEYYHLIDGRAIPHWIMETVRKTYNARSAGGFDYDRFASKIMKLIGIDSP